jgi:hypothetical protein
LAGIHRKTYKPEKQHALQLVTEATTRTAGFIHSQTAQARFLDAGALVKRTHGN